MRVLALNSGSSSLKFAILELTTAEPEGGVGDGRSLGGGAVSGIGGSATLHAADGGTGAARITRPVRDHEEAVTWLFAHLGGSLPNRVDAVGHRVVHGGDRFSGAVRIDPDVLAGIERLTELAPLHNRAALAGIRGARAALGAEFPMVAVFDTTFHRTMPAAAATYAIDQGLAGRHGIRRYGFHGIAHASMAAGVAALTGRPLDGLRLITLHLGSGCSITAIREGRSVDTSMGFTPLEGLVMGTRSGDLDPAVVPYLARREGVGAETVEAWLNERSGLLGVSGLSSDMRALLAAAEREPDGRAALAVAVFCYRARKYVGAYLAALGGADAVVFGGGIGEQAPAIRARICAGMEWCGLRLEPVHNEAAVGLAPGRGARISPDGAALPAYVVAVDEERWIARETIRCLRAAGGGERGKHG